MRVGVAIGTRKVISDKTGATAIAILLSAPTIENTAEFGVLRLISHRCHIEANTQPMAMKDRYRTYPMTLQKLITKFWNILLSPKKFDDIREVRSRSRTYRWGKRRDAKDAVEDF